jgi:hypothetical protein
MGKTYKKVHTSEKALKNHIKKIKKRGGKINLEDTELFDKNFTLKYSFNKNKK